MWLYLAGLPQGNSEKKLDDMGKMVQGCSQWETTFPAFYHPVDTFQGWGLLSKIHVKVHVC